MARVALSACSEHSPWVLFDGGVSEAAARRCSCVCYVFVQYSHTVFSITSLQLQQICQLSSHSMNTLAAAAGTRI